jgi:prepilin-type N-terminal cleavage/methylation domain-containing protein
MKIFGPIPKDAALVAATFRLRFPAIAAPGRLRVRSLKAAATSPVTCRAFTMVEVAISLAIIGVALVAIIGVLPLGMRTQRDNREETVINQDATVFTEAIRHGQFGLNDLTNYVYAITNYWQAFGPNGQAVRSGVDGYSYSHSRVTQKPPPMNMPVSPDRWPLTNGLHIIGLMSMPEFLDLSWHPTNNMFSGGLSNHIVAYVRSLSGPAIEKPPQDNDIIVGDAFAYRVLCVNAPVAMDTNMFTLTAFEPNQPPYNAALAASLHELRLTFLWPQLPSGALGKGRHTFRTMVAGQITQVFTNNQWLYFYQPQSFTNLVTAQ